MTTSTQTAADGRTISEQNANGQFQSRVEPWMLECFGVEISSDKVERNHRFLEEALELAQACGCSKDDASRLVDYVYGRPLGEPGQEAGGVMVTLAALCLAQGLDMHAEGETELARIWTKVDQIRLKQATKPKHGPLPEAAPHMVPSVPDGWLLARTGLLKQVYGMARAGCEAPTAAYRWCERIDELFHDGRESDEYTDFAEELPDAMIAAAPQPADSVARDARLLNEAIALLDRVVTEVGRTITPELRADIEAAMANDPAAQEGEPPDHVNHHPV